MAKDFDYTRDQEDAIIDALPAKCEEFREEILERVRNGARWNLSFRDLKKKHTYAGPVRKELERVAKPLAKAVAALGAASEEALGCLSASMIATRRPWPTEFFTAPRAIEAARRLHEASQAAAAGEIPYQQGGGRPPKSAAASFADELAGIFEQYTGLRPEREIDFMEDGDPDSGPFVKFASAALKPTGLVKNPSRAIRNALDHYHSRQQTDEKKGI